MKRAATASFSTPGPRALSPSSARRAPACGGQESYEAAVPSGGSSFWEVVSSPSVCYTAAAATGPKFPRESPPAIWLFCCPLILHFLWLPSSPAWELSASFALCDWSLPLPNYYSGPLSLSIWALKLQRVFSSFCCHSFPEAKMPPALVDWTKERVGARQDTKKYSEEKKTVENSNYSILS